jgi:hypothetical protein
MRRLAACLLASLSITAPAFAAVTFGSATTIANGTDLSDPAIVGTGGDAQLFGGFGSDLVYNAADGLYYGMTDRGPGGGFLDYAPRIQAFSIDTTTAGGVANFQLQKTIVFTNADGSTFNGKNPGLLAGDKSVLGKSFDSEGLAIRSNGNFLVADEYGPSLYEFDASGSFVRAFETPSNLMPREASNTLNYVDGRPTITSGRQDNRGFEGLTLSNDGTKAYAILQDPLVNEGPVNSGEAQGRRGQNLRIVEFDVASGDSTAQYIYQLEDRAAINARTPGGGDNDFGANNQGRSIGASAIVALPDGRFAVIERDNRGWGVDPANNSLPVGSKRVYLIDIAGATDVSGRSLAGLATLPADVIPVTKSALPYLDIQAALVAAGIPIAEKLEGLTFSPELADGGRLMFIISDNDFSVTQLEGSPTQFLYCSTDPTSGGNTLVSLGGSCPTGTSLIPTYLYAFKLDRKEAARLGFAVSVPEPATWAMMIGGFALVGMQLRRRRGIGRTVTA